jgi:hypothetical protein
VQEVGPLSFGGRQLDFIAFDGILRIPLGGQHDRDRRAPMPAQRGSRRQGAGRGRLQEPGERSREPVEDDLRLRVPETRVELDNPHSIGSQGQARVQQSLIRSAAPPQFIDSRLNDSGHHLSRQILGCPGNRGVRAHAARIRALAAVVGALEVLRREERDRGRAVAEREQAHLRAVQVLLDDDLAAGGGVLAGHGEIGRDHDALAGGQRVVLHHVRRTEERQRLVCLGVAGHRARRGGRDSRRAHDLLGVRLGALDPRRGGVRTEHGQAGVPQRVSHSGDQRRLGADHDQVGAEPAGERGDIARIVRLDLVQLGQAGDSGVAGRRVQFRDRRIQAQRTDNGVLTAARTDNKYSHVAGAYRSGRRDKVWSRRGPMPMALTGAPDSSSIVLTYAFAALGRSSNDLQSEMSSHQPSRYS